MRAVETPGYPRFEAARGLDGVERPKDGDGCCLEPEVLRVDLGGVDERGIDVGIASFAAASDPGKPGQFLSNGQASKAGLNVSIHDASWGAFVNIIRAKAQAAVRRALDLDPRRTAHANEHAARNISRDGLALLAFEQGDAA